VASSRSCNAVLEFNLKGNDNYANLIDGKNNIFFIMKNQNLYKIIVYICKNYYLYVKKYIFIYIKIYL